jgi:hypothetical protein
VLLGHETEGENYRHLLTRLSLRRSP